MNGINGLKPFLFEDKWGYSDKEGNVIVEPMWDYADNFHEGFAVVRNDKGLYGFLNTDGQLSIRCQYEEAMKFIHGIALVKTKVGKWEHINCKGDNLNSCPWIDVYPYSEGLAAVRKPINDIDQICGVSARYGFINEERELIIQCDYSQVSSFRKGYAKITTVFGDSGYIDKEGKFKYSLESMKPYDDSKNLIPLPIEWAKKWDLEINNIFDGSLHYLKYIEGLSIVIGNNGKFGFIDIQGELVIPCKWRWANEFHDGMAFVVNDNLKVGYIDKKGEFVIPPKWNKAMPFYSCSTDWSHTSIAFSEGLAAVKGKNNRWGFIDTKGKLQLANRWIEIRNFSEGYAAVKGLNGRYGFIDYRGNLICKLRWASVSDFPEGMACVYDDNIEKYGFINSCGELQIPCKFDSWDDFHEGVAYVELHRKKIPIDEVGDRIEAEHDKPIDSESSSYERYRGSYAQDEMGYSDDDIDTIFEGDSDAYWNID